MLQRQAVAGFDLDGRHAFAHQGKQPRQGLRQQLGSVAARVARTVDAMPPPARAMSS
jgi:hypothetical protein